MIVKNNTRVSSRGSGITEQIGRSKPSSPVRKEEPQKAREGERSRVIRESSVIGENSRPLNIAGFNRDGRKTPITERIVRSGEARQTGDIRRDFSISRLHKPTPAKVVNRMNMVNNNRAPRLIERTDRGTEFRRSHPNSRAIYEDQIHASRNMYHNEHIYRDYHDRFCHRIIWPGYSFRVYYGWGPYASFHYVYPYYHRRYIFVSLGGYWPIDYGYLRYYWYPSHLYDWYGYNPIARQVDGDTYNYYTYNYYNDQSTPTTEYSPTDSGINPVDHTTFADVREKLAEQQAQAPAPDAETLSDTRFDEAVKAFEQGNYAAAADKLAEAMTLAPEDVILPFAYAQALFAEGKCSEAAIVIRMALENTKPEQEGVFYPRGLYVKEDVLFAQIEQLAEAARLCPTNADLQLLLGYHQLGTGEIEKSIEALNKAAVNPQNAKAVTVLLGLAEKMKAGNSQQDNN